MDGFTSPTAVTDIHPLVSYLADMTAFWSAAGGALVGAATSGYFSYLFQRRAFHQQRKLREDEILQSQRALGRALIIKLSRIHSNIRTIYQYLRESLRMQDQTDPPMEPWQVVRQLAPLPSPVRFTFDELGMLMGLGNDDVLNSVLSMDAVHDSILGLVQTYHSQREELLARLPISTVQGSLATSRLSMDQATALQLPINVVNGLVNELATHTDRGFRESGQALEDLCKLLRDKLKLEHRVEFPEDLAAEGGKDGPPSG